MFQKNGEIHTAYTEFVVQSILELFLPLKVLSLRGTFWVSPRDDTSRGARCGSLGPCKLLGTASHSQHTLLAAFALLFRSWKIGWAAWNLTISDLLHWFQQNPDIFFSFCWIEDAANSSWFTSDRLDLAEWFNSSHAAGCRKILSHFTERMFLLSFLVITYLHELAQLGGSGGSCVAPSVCISYQRILGPD